MFIPLPNGHACIENYRSYCPDRNSAWTLVCLCQILKTTCQSGCRARRPYFMAAVQLFGGFMETLCRKSSFLVIKHARSSLAASSGKGLWAFWCIRIYLGKCAESFSNITYQWIGWMAVLVWPLLNCQHDFS